MKMVKSLLLGSAAALVAVTAGQAADLPVKARPVQYVKVCSLYGAGFYYMPGTDMCIKIGGWVRYEMTDEANGNLAGSPLSGGNSNSRDTNLLTERARGYITADAREQTAYGVARAYIDVGVNQNDVGNSTGEAAGSAGNDFSSNRAFIQWAGITAGISRSFYDFFNAAVQNYRAGYFPTEDTGDGGWDVLAYTAQLGGGLSATISAESRRTSQIINEAGLAAGSGSTIAPGSLNFGDGYGGYNMPDIVANIRVDQAWGSAQVMGALHQLNSQYYGTLETSGGPSTTWGWVIGAGAHINTPFITPGDYIEGEVNYTEGALNYLWNSTRANMGNVQGGTMGYGLQADCVYGSAGAVGVAGATSTTSCEKTSAFSAELSYEHYWTPQWHESFTGGYMNVNYDGAANGMLCALEGESGGTVGSAATALPGCNNNWSYWAAGSRLQWDVTKSFYIGVEALYSQLISATSSTGLVPTAAAVGAPTLCGTAPAAGGGCAVKDEGNWAFTLRIHKDFLP